MDKLHHLVYVVEFSFTAQTVEMHKDEHEIQKTVLRFINTNWNTSKIIELVHKLYIINKSETPILEKSRMEVRADYEHLLLVITRESAERLEISGTISIKEGDGNFYVPTFESAKQLRKALTRIKTAEAEVFTLNPIVTGDNEASIAEVSIIPALALL